MPNVELIEKKTDYSAAGTTAWYVKLKMRVYYRAYATESYKNLLL